MSGEIVTAERRAELVAWMLGEADARTAASIEEELGRGGALAAERARLEGVLGLLARHAKELAPASAAREAPLDAALIDAARREAGRRRGWRVVGRPLAAAAVVTLAVGVTLFAGGGLDRWLGAPEVANAPSGERVAALDEQVAAKLRGLGYVGGYDTEATRHDSAGADGRPGTAKPDARVDALAPASAPLVPDDQAAQLRALVEEAGTYRGPGDTVVPHTSIVVDRPPADALPEHVRAGLDAALAQQPGAGGGESDAEALVGAYRDADEATRQRMEAEMIAANQKLGVVLPPVQRRIEGARGQVEAPAAAAAATGAPAAGTTTAGRAVHGAGEVLRIEHSDPTIVDLRGSAAQSTAELGYDDEDVIAGSDDYFLGQGERRALGLPPRPPDPDVVIARCCLLPHETPEQYFLRSFGTRPFEETRLRALSTFAASVDTASYTHARAYLERGELPPEDLVRTEAFVNAFRDAYGDVGPEEGAFALHLELAPSPFAEPHRAAWLLRAAVVAKDVAHEERPSLALTFVVDVSGSMAPANRLPLVKETLVQLVSRLDPDDKVALVTFSNDARLVWPLTRVGLRHDVIDAIRGLETRGSTNFEGGVVLGYEHAAEHFDADYANRVVVLSDGVGNVGATTREAILARVEEQRAVGLYLNTIGVGMGDQNDALLDAMAQHGDGIASYIDDAAEAQKALVDDLVGAFVPVARDVKLQVEFDSAQVGRWRQLGYESRALADRSFRDDAVDAGEVNAGHTIVALWELEDVTFGGDGPLATLRVRHKPPFGAGDAVFEQARSIAGRDAVGHPHAASAGFRLSAAVAQAAELLRASPHRRGASVEALVKELKAASHAIGVSDPARADEPLALALLLGKLEPQLAHRVGRQDPLRLAEETLRFAHYDLAVERTAPGTPDPARIEELEARIATLEARLRALVAERR